MKLHHIGFVVKDILEHAKLYKDMLGFQIISDITHDEVQKCKVAFISSSHSNETVIELIEPVGENSPVTNFLKKGGGLHHICYEVGDVEKKVDCLRGKGALIVCQPVPAAAFEGRKIAFVYMPDRTLIEFVERKSLR